MKYDERPLLELLNRPKSKRHATDLAQVLREQFPDALPQVTMSESGPQVCLAHVLTIRQKGAFNNLLPGIAMAYSPDNQQVCEAMQACFDRIAKDEFDPFTWKAPLWEAMATWGDESLGNRIMASKSKLGMSWLVGVHASPEDYVSKSFERLHRMGVDLDRTHEVDVAIGDDRRATTSAMSLAVSMRMTGVVVQLLDIGCDPDFYVRMMPEGERVTPMSIAIDNVTRKGQDTTAHEKSVQICSILRSTVAKRHALAAIDELSMSTPVGAGARP